MRRVEQKKWAELSGIWNALYEGNPYATIYQSYEYLTLTKKGMPALIRPFELMTLREINYVLYVDDQVRAVLPLLVQQKRTSVTAYIRGQFTQCDYLDFIYRSDFNYDDFRFLMDSINEAYGSVRFHFERISDRSLIYEYCKMYFPQGPDEVRPCVTIPIEKGYEQWYNGLSYSYRRKIRNIHNRLERDNVKWNVAFYFGKPVDRRTNQEMVRLHGILLYNKNDFEFGRFRKVGILLFRMRRMIDPLTKALKNSKSNFHAIAYMEGKIASYMSGFQCNDGRIVLNRFVMNRAYSKYSAGGLLIYSVIKELTGKSQNGELRTRELDMARGDAQYKYDYGGITRYNYFFYNTFKTENSRDEICSAEKLEGTEERLENTL